MKTKYAVLFAGIFSAMLLAGTATAAETFLADKHAAAGMKCESCHAETPAQKAVPTQKCLSCHGDYEKLKEATKDVKPNPHYTHMLEQQCSECHRAHTKSVDMCADCHQFKYNVP